MADGAAVWRPVARCVVFCSPCMKGCSRGRYPYGLCSMADLSLRNIKKIYDKNVTAVHEFNLEIADKEFIVLVGPSGCGKSTTLRMIAGLEDISEGDLLIGGKRVNDVEPKDRDIAMVFQNYALYPHMTVYENMAFSLKLRHVSKDEIDKKVRDAAAILGITEYLERKPKALSGGQRQRVAIGRAIVREPQVFLMDEPLSNLDAKLRNQMRAEIIKLRQRIDTTFIYVTHDQTEAMTLGDRIVIMRDGYIMQIGTPQMNLFNARLEKIGEGYQVSCAGATIALSDRIQARLTEKQVGERDIILGVRPEHVLLKSEKSSYTISATVDVSEMMGSEVYLHVTAAGKDAVLRIPTTELTEEQRGGFSYGTEIHFTFRSDLLHLFDPQTEKSLLL